MQNKYIALWHDHDEIYSHIIALKDSVDEAHQAIKDHIKECEWETELPPFNGFDDENMWCHVDVRSESTFQISMIN